MMENACLNKQLIYLKPITNNKSMINYLPLKLFRRCLLSPGPPPPLRCPSMAAPSWHNTCKITILSTTLPPRRELCHEIE